MMCQAGNDSCNMDALLYVLNVKYTLLSLTGLKSYLSPLSKAVKR